jgi:chemotaxis protein CheD
MRPLVPLKVDPPKTTFSAEASDSAFSNAHFLHAGQVYVSTEGQFISIILGSCVAACVWDSASGIGGATHFLLPIWDGRNAPSPRYGDVAVSMLLQRLLEAGADRNQMRAKVFGGGCMFDSSRQPASHQEPHLGSRNVEIAIEMFNKARIPVVSKVVGVNRGQRIRFRTDTGEATITVL